MSTPMIHLFIVFIHSIRQYCYLYAESGTSLCVNVSFAHTKSLFVHANVQIGILYVPLFICSSLEFPKAKFLPIMNLVCRFRSALIFFPFWVVPTRINAEVVAA